MKYTVKSTLSNQLKVAPGRKWFIAKNLFHVINGTKSDPPLLTDLQRPLKTL